MTPRQRAARLLLALVSLLGCEVTRDQPPPREDPGYSFEGGVSALVGAVQSWRTERGCVSCHTNGWGLVAQPVIAPGSDEVAQGRSFAQGYLRQSIGPDAKPRGQYGSVEGVVATTAFLALSDARSGGGLHEATREGLDHAWGLLDGSGTWEDWLQCNWPPFESDAEFGPALMLVALGELREAAELTTRDLEMARRLEGYLRRTPPYGLHGKAMRLWAGSSWPKVMLEEQRRGWREELVKAQGEDGGWSMASLAGPTWQRDDQEGQATVSEAYPTAFCVYVLQQTMPELEGSVVSAGLRWLREHQREGGDWFTRSPRRDGKHYISRAATAFALMALAEGE